jgi:hypothetical protein
MLTQFELKQRINLEKKIARVIVRDAIRAGYSLNVNNGGDGNELTEPSTDHATVIRAMFQTDQEHLLVYNSSNGKQIGWVFFVYGNDGWDIVNDYTVNLEPIMKRADAIADKHS